MRRRWLALVIAGACVLASSCDRIPGTPEFAARREIKAAAFDPGAVQIRYIGSSADAVCGEMNGKNRMGAYVGFTPFIYERTLGMLSIYQGAPSVSDLRMAGYMSDGPEQDNAFLEIGLKCQFPDDWKEKCMRLGAGPVVENKAFCDAWKAGKAADLPGARD